MSLSSEHIGLYFGSFNPIHNGHLAIAGFLLANTDLDEVWFVVSPQSPFKSESSLLDDDHRYKMVQLAIKKNIRLKACNIEFSLPKPSYTINTLRALEEKYPDKKFALIMGSDNLDNFDKWKDYKDIIDHHRIWVYPRHGSDVGKFKNHPSVRLINAPLLDISSTNIRKLIHEGKDVSRMVPKNVLTHINKMNFYRANV
ncbi:MAG TPA: nicotinate (nicotinamide) nucleotide adenylyltransferase [Bacteroidales bacterium]|nr:nicotinate (nicotinamide) nucleotide adenylyltransferase [Bacteroidales bacterium]